ncbi:MAG: hypothetical protein Q8P18_12290 [Pseudomonadota bacterium]|nr:hypothetical protein [Pseudomonadota bacterium]
MRRLLLFAVPLLAGCSGPDPDAFCAGFAPDPWDPLLEPDVRVDEATAVWEVVGAATVVTTGADTAASASCGAPPCLAVTGPGGAALALQLNRGVDHVVSGTLFTDTPVTLTVTHTATDGPLRTLAEQTFESGVSTAFELPVVIDAAGADIGITLTLEELGTATLDDFAVTGERWAASPDAPAAPVRVGVLIHIEDDPNFLLREDTWRRRARLIEALSGMFAAHGAHLTLQADATFVRGAANWDEGWIAARNAEGMGWSVHIHDEASEGGVEQAIRDGRTALRESGALTSDLNGGFGEAPWLEARLAGITSLTAFKDPATQRGLPHVQVQPWRLGDGVGSSDLDAFLLHDPEGPVLYLSGHDVREVEHARFPLVATQTLSQVLAHARPDHVNVWYWVLHVDGFGPPMDDDADMDAYLDGAALQDDLAAYDAFLTDTTDPLVSNGSVVYDTPVGMATAWREWNAACEQGDTAR